MKKILALLVVLSMMTMLFAGGGQETTAAADDTPTVRLMTDVVGIDDKSFNADAWKGITSFYGDTPENAANRGKYYDVVTSQTQDMYIPNFQQALDEDYDLLICCGFSFSDPVGQLAPLNPDAKFTVIDVDWLSGDNIRQYIYREEEGSYLIGMIAALQSQKDGIQNAKFGFIGGVPSASLTKFEMGYIQGIHSVLPQAEIVDYYTNDWGGVDKAKAQAKNWYDNGVYCVFSAAGAAGNGTIAQAKEYRLAGKNVWAIGVDSDQFSDGLYNATDSAVLTSMVKRVNNATRESLELVKKGEFKGGVISLGLKEDGLDFTKTNKALEADIIAKVDAAKADIADGKIKIYKKYADAKAAGAAPAGLGAID